MGAQAAGWYPDGQGGLRWWDAERWVMPAPPSAVLSAEAPGFWLPLFHMLLRQAVLDPACLVVVEGSQLRITNSRGRVLLSGPLDRIEIHRTWMGNLSLRHLDTGARVRLTYGSIRRVHERLREQIPPGWAELRFDDRAALHNPRLGITVGILRAQAGITRRLTAELVARGAHQV